MCHASLFTFVLHLLCIHSDKSYYLIKSSTQFVLTKYRPSILLSFASQKECIRTRSEPLQSFSNLRAMVASDKVGAPNSKKEAIITSGNHLIKPLLSGLVSSTITTVIYQPLELVKTRIQIGKNYESRRLFGRLTKTALVLSRDQGISYLWRGTGAVSI